MINHSRASFKVKPTCFRISCHDDVIRPCLEVLYVVPVVSEVSGHGDAMEIKQCGTRKLLHLWKGHYWEIHSSSIYIFNPGWCFNSKHHTGKPLPFDSFPIELAVVCVLQHHSALLFLWYMTSNDLNELTAQNFSNLNDHIKLSSSHLVISYWKFTRINVRSAREISANWTYFEKCILNQSGFKNSETAHSPCNVLFQSEVVRRCYNKESVSYIMLTTTCCTISWSDWRLFYSNKILSLQCHRLLGRL